MNTKTRSTTRDLVLAALFLALAFVLPMITRPMCLRSAICSAPCTSRCCWQALCWAALGLALGLPPCCSLGAVRDAPDVPHCHRHGL